MKKVIIASLVLFTILTSCGNKSKDQKTNIIQSLDHVAMVGNMNLRTIMKKGKLLANIPELGMAMAFSPIKINDSANTGFDPLSNKYFAINNNPETGNGDFIALFDIQDKEKFRATISKQLPENIEEREKDGFVILTFSEGDNGGALCYNDKIGLVISQFNINEEKIALSAERVDEIIGFASAPKKNDLDAKTKEVLSGSNDISLAYYQKNSMKMIQKFQEQSGQKTNLDEDAMSKIEDASSLMTLNGNSGELVLNIANDGYDKIKETKYDVLGSKGVGAEILSSLTETPKDILGLMTMNLNMEKLVYLMKEDKDFSEEMNNEFDEKYLDYFTGEFSGVLTRASNVNREPLMSLVANINNETEFIAALDTVKHLNKVNSNLWTIKPKQRDLEAEYAWMDEEEREFFMEIEKEKADRNEGFLAIKEGKLFVSSDSVSASKFANGDKLSSIEIANFESSDATSNPFYLFINTDKSNYPNMAHSFIEKIEFVKGKADWNGSELKISFTDKGVNGWDGIIKSIASNKNLFM